MTELKAGPLFKDFEELKNSLLNDSSEVESWLCTVVGDPKRLKEVLLKGAKMGRGRKPDAMTRLICRTLNGMLDAGDKITAIRVLRSLYKYGSSGICVLVIVNKC